MAPASRSAPWLAPPNDSQNFFTIISVSKIVAQVVITTAMLTRFRAAIETAEVGYTAWVAWVFLRGADRFLVAMITPKRRARPLCGPALTPSLPGFAPDR